MNSATSHLRLEIPRVVETLEANLQDLLEGHSARGALIGLSGGIDSAVLSTMAVRALGKDAVHVVYLYDRTSSKKLAQRARQMAEWLDLELQARDIHSAMQARGVYDPFLLRVTRLSGSVNRLLHGFYRSRMGESPFMSSLRKGHAAFSGQGFQHPVYEQTIGNPEASFSARHIHRREVLEKEAEAHDLVLLGAANRTEWLVGWFVKDGVDDLPLQPLKGLYKTQIRQLADFLRIPDSIRSQPPSPDMMKGITDEYALGMRYEKIDLALDHLEGGISGEELLTAGVTTNELRHVREMKRFSRWKRVGPHDMPAPVDGGPGGGFRSSIREDTASGEL